MRSSPTEPQPGSITGAPLGSIPDPALIPILAIVLLISAFKMAHHS